MTEDDKMKEIFQEQREEAQRCCGNCFDKWLQTEDTHAKRIYIKGFRAGQVSTKSQKDGEV